jgi:hypothetical protein
LVAGRHGCEKTSLGGSPQRCLSKDGDGRGSLHRDDRIFAAEIIGSVSVCLPVILPSFAIQQIPETIVLACIECDAGRESPILALLQRMAAAAPIVKIAAQMDLLGFYL